MVTHARCHRNSLASELGDFVHAAAQKWLLTDDSASIGQRFAPEIFREIRLGCEAIF
jgi:hypothetical protein